jgi:hypothetical protein
LFRNKDDFDKALATKNHKLEGNLLRVHLSGTQF